MAEFGPSSRWICSNLTKLALWFAPALRQVNRSHSLQGCFHPMLKANAVSFSMAWNSLLNWLVPRRTQLAELRSQWGKPGTAMTWHASAYFDLVRNEGSDVRVDDTTWLDLGLPKIFSQLDTTTTRLGSQCLFAMLRTYADDPHQLAAPYAGAGMLQMHAALREKIQLTLSVLKDDGHADIADIVFGDPPQAVKHPKLLLLWSALSLLIVVGAIASAWPPWLGFSAIAVNVAVLVRVHWNVQRDATALIHALGMLAVANGLAAISMDGAPFGVMHQLREQTPLRHQVQKRLHWLAWLQNVLFISPSKTGSGLLASV